jgi:hypothetical protein
MRFNPTIAIRSLCVLMIAGSFLSCEGSHSMMKPASQRVPEGPTAAAHPEPLAYPMTTAHAAAAAPPPSVFESFAPGTGAAVRPDSAPASAPRHRTWTSPPHRSATPLATALPHAPPQRSHANDGTSDVNGLRDGWYSYTRPKTMEYHQKETFTLRVSRQRNVLHERQIAVIGEGDVVTASTTKLSQAVTAYLAGGDDFEVKPLGNPDAKKTIPAAEYREWQWDIVPQHGGTGRLVLTIYALAADGNSPAETIARIEIPVHISNVDVFWHWLLDHPEFVWLFGVSVVTSAGGVVLSRRKNRPLQKRHGGTQARTPKTKIVTPPPGTNARRTSPPAPKRKRATPAESKSEVETAPQRSSQHAAVDRPDDVKHGPRDG